MEPCLVLSVFPGIDLFGKAFEDNGFCVVRGPDLLWGGNIKTFHPPAGRFNGIIGGPPCQLFSDLHIANPRTGKHGNLIPEFERVVFESQPEWFEMENVVGAPIPTVKGYKVKDIILNNRQFGAEQNRRRRFSFGTRIGVDLKDYLEFLPENPIYETAVLAGHDDYISKKGWNAPPRSMQKYCELQGLPSNFTDEMPFTAQGKKKVIGNGVPLFMGNAIAKAIQKILEMKCL